MLHTKFGKIGPVVLEKKMLTYGGLWMTDDNGCQPIAIGHLSNQVGVFWEDFYGFFFSASFHSQL